MPVRSSSRRVASIGPSRWKYGFDPTSAWSTIRARGVRPRACASSESINSTADAPSLICEEVPAVCRPSGSTVRSPAKPSRVVSRRPSSAETVLISSVGLPVSLSITGLCSGVISRSKRPSSTAMRALRWDSNPSTSRSSRVRPRFLAILSAPSNWLGMSIVQDSGRGSPAPGGTLAPNGMRLIDSTPQAIPTLIVSALIMSLIKCAACCPEPHWASIVVAPVGWGRPACNHARRTMSLDCSPAWETQPPTTCSTISGSTPALSRTSRWTCPSSSPGCMPASPPLRFPSGVRTASMMTGFPMVQN